MGSPERRADSQTGGLSGEREVAQSDQIEHSAKPAKTAGKLADWRAGLVEELAEIMRRRPERAAEFGRYIEEQEGNGGEHEGGEHEGEAGGGAPPARGRGRDPPAAPGRLTGSGRTGAPIRAPDPSALPRSRRGRDPGDR